MSGSADTNRVGIFARFFNGTVLRFPLAVLVVVFAATSFFGYWLKDFKFDASSDSIVLENDADLAYYDKTRELFGSDDYVVITLTPHGDMLGEETLAALGEMRNAFSAMENVESVTSILSVPLFHSPKIPIFMLAAGYNTLETERVDLSLAGDELIASPLYKDYLISLDGKTTAIQVTFRENDAAYKAIEQERKDLRAKRSAQGLSAEEKARLNEVDAAYTTQYHEWLDGRIVDIETVRGIVARHTSVGEMHIGGVPMIMADIISYVRNDMIVFGLGVIGLIVVMLVVLFRKVKWVVLPALTCGLTIVIMMGYLGYVSWATTIVTSNLTSLLTIITMAMTIHVVVRYRELYAGNPEMSNRELIFATIRKVAKPCLYTSLTTIVGFGSLIVSQIPPVMDFGKMMAIGIAISYVLCFVFLPAALMFFPKGKQPPARLAKLTGSPLTVFARFTERHGRVIAVASVIIFVLSIVGVRRLEVENRFIDYFDEETPIYQGMSVIDDRIGGTTPLEVVLEGDREDYWLEDENRAHLREVHEWLDALPETGKVISPDTMVRMLEQINDGLPVNRKLLDMGLGMLPAELEEAVVGPYMTPEHDQVRIAMRVRESSKDLRRKELMATITEYLESNPNLPEGSAHVTGIFVLYNNMLQSLFASQIQTIATVFLAIWLMFIVLFRSVKLATIGIIPNILPVAMVLGTLGWVGIPLDIMTIMTAAITLGIAVDDTVHYIHRFKVEFPKDRNYRAAMHRCHNSIGYAILYTSLTIIAGFSVLTLSNFVPSVYFGIFTSMAMVVALLAAVTVLPLLLIAWKPLGPEGGATE